MNLTKENTIFEDLILSASNINQWSIQTPNLYTVRVEVFSNDGDDVDTVEAKVGFRTWCSSARPLVTSLKYHCITHVFENIFNRIPQISLYHSRVREHFQSYPSKITVSLTCLRTFSITSLKYHCITHHYHRMLRSNTGTSSRTGRKSCRRKVMS